MNKIDKCLAKLIKIKKRGVPKNKKWKKRNYNWHHRDTKNHKRILQTYMCQHTGQPRRNGQISRKSLPAKTESGRNRWFEQTDH